MDKMKPGNIIMFSAGSTTSGASHMAVYIGLRTDGNHWFSHSTAPDGTAICYDTIEEYASRGYIGKGNSQCTYMTAWNIESGSDVIMEEGLPVRVIKENESCNKLSGAVFTVTVNNQSYQMTECYIDDPTIEKGIYGLYEHSILYDDETGTNLDVYTELVFTAGTNITITETKAPAGYDLPLEQSMETTFSGDEIITVTFADKETLPVYQNVDVSTTQPLTIIRHISLIKKDSITGEPLEVATFEIFKGDESLGEYITDKNGMINFDDSDTYNYSVSTSDYWYVSNYSNLTDSMKQKSIDNATELGYRGDLTKLFTLENDATSAAKAYKDSFVAGLIE